jgi:hypothetical protein
VQTAAKMADFRAGFLCSASLADATHLVTAFRIGLKEVGFVEGQNDDADCLRERGRSGSAWLGCQPQPWPTALERTRIDYAFGACQPRV